MKNFANTHAKLRKSVLSLVVICISVFVQMVPSFVVPTEAAQGVPSVPAQPSEESFPLVPYLEIFVDTSSTLTVEDIQEPDVQAQFRPYLLAESKKPAGAVWFRFTVAERAEGQEEHTLLIDMGDSTAQQPKMFAPVTHPVQKTRKWQEFSPSQRAIFLMPEAEDTQLVCYIRLDSEPSIWFAPFVRTPHNAATSLELLAYPAATVALCMVVLLCLLRAFTERGQWRIWTGLYTGVALFYAINGLPVISQGHIPMEHLLSVLAPGVALILLPHVGRHVMDTPQHSRSFDVQYMLLTLVGAVVALLPLVPGFVWLVRYLALWPALTLLLVPTTIAACMSGLMGARRFLLACLLPPLGVGLALVGLEPAGVSMFPVAALPAFPLWGVALGALILSGTTSPRLYGSDGEVGTSTLEPTVESVVQSDPNLRLVPVEEAQSLESEGVDEMNGTLKKAAADLEEQLRWPVEQLNREVAALEGCALPIAARETINSLSTTARDIANILQAPAHQRMAAPTMGGIEEYVFDLQSLLRQAHDSVSPVADKKNIALSWFMPPHLSQCYKGDALQLLFVLRLLLESSVRSTHRGAVQLAVRRVPESVNPGHLLFTITDTGTGKPPQERSVTALARAWELSASYHGFLGVESNAHGASISFTVNCEVCTSADKETSEQVQEKAMRRPVVIISDNAEDRHRWGFFLEKIDNPVVEVRNCDEAVIFFKENPVALMIFDGRMPTVFIEKAMQTLQHICQEQELLFPECLVVYVQDELDTEFEALFTAMGFTHFLPLPVTRPNLFEQVERVLTLQEQVSEDEEPYEEAVENPQEQSVAFGEATESSVYPEQENNIADETTENVSYEQTEQSAVEAEEEIIDTGMPILDLHATSSDPMPTMHEETAQQATQEWGSEGTEVVQEESVEDSVQYQDEEPTYAEEGPVVPPVLVATTSTGDEEHEHTVQTLAEESANIHKLLEKASRPAPSEDKSNAVYLTSLVDMDSAQEGEQTSLEQDAQRASSEAAQVKSIPKKAKIVARRKKIEEPSAPPVETGASVQEPVQPEPQRTQDVPTRPVVKLVPKSMAERKGAVPFEPSSLSSIGGGGSEWVGEPMPIGSPMPSASAVFTQYNDAAETPTPQPSQVTSPQQGTVTPPVEAEPQAAVEQENTSSAPVAAQTKTVRIRKLSSIKKTAQNVAQTQADPKPEPKLESSVERASISGKIQTAIRPVGERPESDMASDWVGEPMPVKKVSAEPSKSAQTTQALFGDAPLSFTPTQEPADTAPEEIEVVEKLSMDSPSRDVSADERGREELRHLRSYLDKIEDAKPVQKASVFEKLKGKPLTDAAKQDEPQSSSPFEWVGDPQPIAMQEPEKEVPSAKKVVMQATTKKKVVEPKVTSAPKTVATPPSEPVHESRQEEESFTADAVPLSFQEELSPIAILLIDLDRWLQEAKDHLVAGELEGVERAAADMASNAESFGLRTLGRLARTVEAAARAQDVGALRDLLPELEMSVHRNRAALQG